MLESWNQYWRVKPKYRIAQQMSFKKPSKTVELLLNSCGKVKYFSGIQEKSKAHESSWNTIAIRLFGLAQQRSNWENNFLTFLFRFVHRWKLTNVVKPLPLLLQTGYNSVWVNLKPNKTQSTRRIIMRPLEHSRFCRCGLQDETGVHITWKQVVQTWWI